MYVECEDDDDSLQRLEQFGRVVHDAFLTLPSHESTAPKSPNPELESELRALSLDIEFYRVIGDTNSAGVVVSRTADEPVEFSRSLNNRVVNLVPVPDITCVSHWVNEETQTVGISGIVARALERRSRFARPAANDGARSVGADE